MARVSGARGGRCSSLECRQQLARWQRAEPRNAASLIRVVVSVCIGNVDMADLRTGEERENISWCSLLLYVKDSKLRHT